MEEGALLEPMSVGVHACRRAGVGLGSSVLILGSGPIGLVTLLTAKAMGASNILITDIVAERLAMAKSLGATHTLLIEKGRSEAENVQLVHKLMGEMPDKTIDCSGAESTSRMAILSTRAGKTIHSLSLSYFHSHSQFYRLFLFAPIFFPPLFLFDICSLQIFYYFRHRWCGRFGGNGSTRTETAHRRWLGERSRHSWCIPLL